MNEKCLLIDMSASADIILVKDYTEISKPNDLEIETEIPGYN